MYTILKAFWNIIRISSGIHRLQPETNTGIFESQVPGTSHIL